MADIEIGDFVMARDNVTTTKVDFAEVTAITNQGIELSCYGTRSTKPSKAKFHKVFTKGAVVYLGKPRQVKNATRWTWQVELGDIDELIPLTGLELTKAGKLSSNSIRRLLAVKPSLKLRTF